MDVPSASLAWRRRSALTLARSQPSRDAIPLPVFKSAVSPSRHLKRLVRVVCGRPSVGKDFFEASAHRWSVRSCVRPVHAALPCAAGHNALRGHRSRSIPRARSARPKWVFPSPRFRPALMHSLLFALPNLVGAFWRRFLCRGRTCKGRFPIRFPACHHRPDCPRHLVGRATAATFAERRAIS